VSVRLPLLPGVHDARAGSAHAQSDVGAAPRARVRGAVVTASARDGQGLAFGRALAAALAAAGRCVVLVAPHGARPSEAPRQPAPAGLREVSIAPDRGDVPAALRSAAAGCDVVVVVDPELAARISGMLDVWVGARPRPGEDAAMAHVHASCQLELRSSAHAVAELLAAELLTGAFSLVEPLGWQ